MKKIFGKDGVLSRFVSHQRFLTALIISAVFSFVYIAANGFKIVGGNDDYCAFRVFLGGNEAVPNIGIFLTAFCARIQPLFGAVNVYMVLQELICFLSLVSVNYFFLSKLGVKKGLFYTAVFDVIFFSCLIVEILYTYTAVLASTAGLLCLFYGGVCEKRGKVKALQLVAGFLFVLIGSQLRFAPFLACCGIGAAFAVGVFISYTLKSRKGSKPGKALVSALKKYGVTGILLVTAVAAAVGVNTLSEMIKNSSEDYRQLSGYYESLSAVNDSKMYEDYDDPDAFGDAGIVSYEDIYSLRYWFVDESFYTVDRLDKISEAIYEQNDDGILTKSIAAQMLFPFKTAFEELINSRMILLYLFILIVAVFGTVIISIMFPKIKWPLIKLILLIFLWSFFFMISDVFAIESILILPLIAVSLVITIRYDRFQAVITLSLIAGLLVMYSYLVSVRLLFYTLFAPLFPAFALMIFGISGENAVNIEKKPKLRKVLRSALAISLAAVSVFMGVYVFISHVRVSDTESNPAMEEYIESHPETIFLVNETMLSKLYYDPFILTEEHPNVVSYGLWLTKAKYYKNAQKRNGIDDLFTDAVNSNMRLIIWEDDILYGEDEMRLPLFYLKQYYNNHYAEEGERFDIKRTDRIENYSLYAIVSEPAVEE